jgi:cysteinyl-tRNA synthetase
MAIQLLGEQIDIHGGGQDLVFPHHENEIAQSESCTGKVPFARYWVHNGLLRPSEDQEKMTRHLGNFVSCQEALERYHPDAIRLFILSSHYRSPLTWSEEGVLATERGLERLRVAVREVGASGGGEGDGLLEAAEEARRGFTEALDDDFNTARATSYLHEVARTINQARDSGTSGQAIAAAQAALREMTDVFGLTLEEPEAPREAAPFIELLIAVRNDLRAARQWALADKIRAELGSLGITLEDSPTGTTWRVR